MSNKKQTAIDFLLSRLPLGVRNSLIENGVAEKAKELEKQQMIESHAVGRIKQCSGLMTDGEQYYNETYGKDIKGDS